MKYKTWDAALLAEHRHNRRGDISAAGGTGEGRAGERLHPDIISKIYKRVVRWIGMSKKQVN
jgi:hypothetical protein